MPTRPIQSYHKVSARNNKPSHTTPDELQHGCLLLGLPQESLTHISSYLPLPSLLALARTCRRLCQHVDDDNTWLRAFFTQFFGIGPEHDLDKKHNLLFRRTENTWRKEFILRYTTNRRWASSRNSTVTYEPQDSTIDAVHLMSDQTLLTSSIQYGTVARSIPLNGRVLKGCIDTFGTGLGIGNPNAEFTPNVSACALSSDGGTARVFWGKHNGEVALTVTKRVMDPRAVSKLIRCSVDDQHEGAVQQFVPDPDSNSFLSAGADGRMKLWDTQTLRLLWSTDKQQLSLITDPFVSIVGCLSDGLIAGALKSGDILVYNLHESETPADGRHVCSTHHRRISSLIRGEKSQPAVRGDEPLPESQITKLWLHCMGGSTVILLVQYTHHTQFYRVQVDVRTLDVTATPFGDSSFGDISVAEPVFSTNPRDSSMVIVGDLLGFVSIYDADVPSQASVVPVHRFEAHSDAVTAISYTATLFATGTAAGSTVVWESLTLEPMCCFSTPAPRPAPRGDRNAVSRILLGKEHVLIVVGNHVMTWRVGSPNGREHQHKKPRHANTKTKGHQQYEMYKDIAESYMELEHERAHNQRIYGPEREQRSTLDKLGLSELEAVQYVLMLSREQEARQQRTVVDDGVFEGDFDDIPGTPTTSWSRSTLSAPFSLLHSSPKSHHRNCRQYPRVSLPVSNEKVQVSPRFVPEPMEAGTCISPLTSLAIGTGVQPSPMTTRSTSLSSLDHFPAISSSLSSTSSSKRGTSGSPEQPRSAWSTPLQSVSSSPGPSSPRPRVVAPVMTRTRSSNMSLLSADIAQYREASRTGDQDAEGMDDDLRLAIELSLAEARSKRESV